MKNISYLFLSILISFVGCSGTVKGDINNKNEKKINIIRFDKDIYNYLQQPDIDKENRLKKEYPLLLPAFGRIAMDNSDPTTFFSNMQEYFSHPSLMNIYKDALSSFENVSEYEDELTKANVNIEKYLKDKKLPQFAMHVSGFRENIIIVNDLISISTDKYMGSDYKAYKEFFQSYERQQMQSKYIVRDYLKAWLMSDVISNNGEQADLLSAMIKEGKLLYALSLLLPEHDADDLVGYTSAQSIWCKNNEKLIWKTLIKNNHLFSSDHMIITRFINDAAYTSTISKESPGRLGCWIGWQIVNQYAKKTGLPVQEIIYADAKTILKGSKYNP